MSVTLIAMLLIAALAGPQPTHAQAVSYPVYVVQSGDTLYWIAGMFGTTLEELMAVNGWGVDNMLRPGDRLMIPSLAGMRGVLTTEYVALGSSLTSLSRRSQASTADLIRLNKLTSPSELFIGREIVVTRAEDQAPMETMPSLSAGESFLEAAVLSGQNPWTLSGMNRIANPNHGLPMDTYYRPSETESPNNLAIPGIRSIVLDNLPLKQGETFLIEVQSEGSVSVRASLAGVEPVFVDMGGGMQMAYGGINSQTELGVYPLTMTFENTDGTTYSFDQYVMVGAGNYTTEPVVQVDVDPATVGTEEERLENEYFREVVKPVTPAQQWTGLWYSPAQSADCITSNFGGRRNYNNGTSSYYHTGLDLGFCNGIDVYAPAGGTVVGVFPDQLVRGNCIVIDHGMGVYTIYMHLKSFLVKTGDVVEPGQLIAEIGSTGRSEGPHLHFEVDIHGTPVNPVTWLQRVFP